MVCVPSSTRRMILSVKTFFTSHVSTLEKAMIEALADRIFFNSSSEIRFGMQALSTGPKPSLMSLLRASLSQLLLQDCMASRMVWSETFEGRCLFPIQAWKQVFAFALFGKTRSKRIRLKQSAPDWQNLMRFFPGRVS